ncbi:hypothetical protein [Kordiimonas aquimaris]|uniref:hypothetical protein n=1 Tax=Kordiimonas aquimaris TaxID=707591 RepID=UPI0021D1FEDE|nr:hypothetical protein [Kordiimonas aquimaris]
MNRCMARLIGSLLLCVSTSAWALQVPDSADASPDISIASMEIPLAYEENGNGVYNDVLKKLTEGYTGNINTSFYPAARFDRIMSGRSADCAYIATDSLSVWESEGIMPDELEFIGPVNTLYVVVYIPSDAPDVTTLEEVKRLNVASDVNLLGVIHSLGIKETLALQSQVQMLNLLAVKRINGLIGYDFDLDFLSRELGHSDKMKKASVRLDSLTDGVLCLKTEKTASFRAHLRARLSELEDSGWLKKAFADY